MKERASVYGVLEGKRVGVEESLLQTADLRPVTLDTKKVENEA